MSSSSTTLPLELWLCIVHYLDMERDISALARTCQAMYRDVGPSLYHHNVIISGCSALIWGTINHSVPTVRYSLEAGADVNRRDAKRGGQTLLHIAAHHGHESIIALLIAWPGIKLDEEDDQSRTPLICAAAMGHDGIVAELLSTGQVNPNRFNVNLYMAVDNNSPLLLAAQNGLHSVVQVLLRHDQTVVDLVNSSGCTPLCLAASNGHSEIVQTLLNMGKADVNHTDDYGKTPLIYAAASGMVACVKFLLSCPEIDIDLPDSSGNTAFTIACANGDISLIRALIESGRVEPDILDDDNNSVLALAAKYGDAPFFNSLLESGIYDINSQNFYGQTPIIAAAEGGNLEIVKAIIAIIATTATGEVEANWKTASSSGHSHSHTAAVPAAVLLIAASKGHISIVDYLLRAEEYAGVSGSNANNALHLAATNGHIEMVKYFFVNNFVNFDDNKISTILCDAAKSGHLKLLKYLLETGSFDLNAADAIQGWTPFMWACYGGHVPIMDFLSGIHAVDLDARDSQGRMAIHCTCLHQHGKSHEKSHDNSHENSPDIRCSDCVLALQILTSNNRDIIMSIDQQGCTPLHYAAANGCIEMLTYLVYSYTTFFKGAGASLAAKDTNGRTPHFYACMFGMVHTQAILYNRYRENDAALAADAYGNTAILVATRNGHDSTIRSLLHQTPDLLLYKDSENQTLFHWAARQENKRVGEELTRAYTLNPEIARAVDDWGINVNAILATQFPRQQQLTRMTPGCEWCRVCCRALDRDRDGDRDGDRAAAATPSYPRCLECY